MRRAIAALAAAWIGCGSGGGGTVEGAVVARDSRYRITAHATPPPALDAAGTLRLHVETLNGWHVTLEAPARLDLSADALSFEPAALRQQHARPLGEDGFEFVTRVRARRVGPDVAHGQLKFGICQGPRANCMIVRREIEVPFEVATGS